MASISFKNVKKTYVGGVEAVCDFSLDIADGRFAALVGESGCGKSTVLRIIAGLERADGGELFIDGESSNDVEPRDRDVAMIFQGFTLYPHKTVFDNLAYGLMLRRVGSAEITRRVTDAADMLGIAHLLKAKPRALSAAEIKRVELARAAVRRPRVFILDEPLDGLDDRARAEILPIVQRLWHELKTTFVYATRSFEDAAAFGAYIAVIKNGAVRQTGMPNDIYDKPSDMYVADYCGSPRINLIKAEAFSENGKTALKFGSNTVVTDAAHYGGLSGDVYLGIRPEHISVVETPNDGDGVSATVDVVERLGNESLLYLYADGKDDYMLARVPDGGIAAGTKVSLRFDARKLRLFAADTGLALDKFDK